MTDTPRRRPPAPTRAGTLSLKPRTAAPSNLAPADAAPAAKSDSRDWRKPASGTGRSRGKASFPEQANTEPVRRSADAGDERPRGDRPPRQDGDRPARPYGDRPPRQDGDRPARPYGDRPPRAAGDRPAGDRPRGDRPPRQEGERPARPDGERPPRHERKAWSGEPRPAPAPSPLRDDGSIRLSKRMTELGLCSRREADEYIEKGWVRVDGRVVSELGSRVKPGQQVELDRRGQTNQDRRVTILLNKPVGYVSGQAEDGYQPASVLITADNRWAEDPSETRYLRTHQNGLAPAGRLDIDSIGLLVFTQDGRVARALIGDDSTIEKEYHVRVEGTVDAAGLKLLNHGLSLDGVALRPAKVSWLNEDQLRFVLREGKKRQIRRMCEQVGLKVVGLKRVRIGRVMLGHLPPGQWRYLGPNEVF
jgi:23S rRNA pseudouridine2604 synthase